MSHPGRAWLSWLVLLAGLVPAVAASPRRAGGALDRTMPRPAVRTPLDTAIFAGGCFWSMVHVFDGVPGVVSVVAGYTGGSIPNPSYSQVSSGGTGHVEAVAVQFDPGRLPYPALLRMFWRNVDPFDASGQFCDRGEQYRSEIFYRDSVQRVEAEASGRAMRDEHLRGTIVTQIVSAGPFYAAEAYHQRYYRTHPVAYAIYRWGCGRDRRLRQIWSGSTGAALQPRDRDS